MTTPKTKLSSVTNELREAYRSTHFNVLEPKQFTLRIDVFSHELAVLYREHDVSTAAFLTAWNPYSETTAQPENERAQKHLLVSLGEIGATVLAGIGEDASGQWPGEPSALALGISRDQAVLLGNEFKQNAIVWAGDNCIPELVFLHETAGAIIHH